MADKPKPGYDYIDIKETVRQHYNDESEKQVNEQINAELSAMYSYLSMVNRLYACLMLTYFNFSRTISIELTWRSPTSPLTSRSVLMKSLSTPRSL
jgi:hypothetical protein